MIPHRKPVPNRSGAIIAAIRDLPRVEDISELDEEKNKKLEKDHADPLSLPQLDINTEKGGSQFTGATSKVEDVPLKNNQPISKPSTEARSNVSVPKPVLPISPPPPEPKSISQVQQVPAPPYQLQSSPRPARVPTPPAHRYPDFPQFRDNIRNYGTEGEVQLSSAAPRARERKQKLGHCWKIYSFLTVALSLMVLVGCYSTHTRYFPLIVVPNNTSAPYDDAYGRSLWGYSGICNVEDGYAFCEHKFVQSFAPPPWLDYTLEVDYQADPEFYSPEVENNTGVVVLSGFKSPIIRQRIFKASAALLIIVLFVLIQSCLIALMCSDETALRYGVFLSALAGMYLIPYCVLVHLAVESFSLEVYAPENRNAVVWGQWGRKGELMGWGLVMVDFIAVLTFLFWIWLLWKFCRQ